MSEPTTGLGVYRAINRVQAEIAEVGIAKDRNNSGQNYKFRGIDDVYNALSSIMAKNGLCIIPRYSARVNEERASKSGGVLFYVTVDGEYDVVCSEDGSKHTAMTYGEAMDSADKATNKAMSAAYKYLCLQLFCIPTEGDNDADGTTHDVAPSRSFTQGRQQSRGSVASQNAPSTMDLVMKFLVPLDDDTADTWATWMVKNCDGCAKPSEMNEKQLEKLWKSIQKATGTTNA